MLISRCAWHPQYHGHRSWLRIVRWRGFRLEFTDGICRRCLERFRVEHRDMFDRRKAEKLDKTA